MSQKVSASEKEVLYALLELGQATAGELHQSLAPERPWAYSTVVTFLRRLEAKGLVDHTRTEGDRAFIFRPTRIAQKSRRTALREILDHVFGGNPLPLMSSLLEETKLQGHELDELRRLIDEHAAKRRKES